MPGASPGMTTGIVSFESEQLAGATSTHGISFRVRIRRPTTGRCFGRRLQPKCGLENVPQELEGSEYEGQQRECHNGVPERLQQKTQEKFDEESDHEGCRFCKRYNHAHLDQVAEALRWNCKESSQQVRNESASEQGRNGRHQEARPMKLPPQTHGGVDWDGIGHAENSSWIEGQTPVADSLAALFECPVEALVVCRKAA